MGKSGTGKLKKTCLHCSKEFLARKDRPGKYCSMSCASKQKPHKKYRIKLKCKECSNEFEVKRYRAKSARFCSRKCLAINRGLRMRKEKHPKWKGGITHRPFQIRKLNELKKIEIGKCEICGNQENLQAHHRHGYMIDSSEIQILCLDCHAKQHPRLKNFIRSHKWKKRKNG